MNLVRMAVGLLVEGFPGLTGSNRWRSTRMENQRLSHGGEPIYEPEDYRSLPSFPQTEGHRGRRLRSSRPEQTVSAINS